MLTKNKQLVLSGKVEVGLGKGRYFMSQAGYRKQFESKLGMDAYRGTLNIRLSKSNIKKLEAIKKRKGILIKGFKKGKKDFGDAVCYNAQLSGIKCALITPKRTVHTKVAELISQTILRKKLKLKDGSRVKFYIYV